MTGLETRFCCEGGGAEESESGRGPSWGSVDLSGCLIRLRFHSKDMELASAFFFYAVFFSLDYSD